jgi:hypothetical protein
MDKNFSYNGIVLNAGFRIGIELYDYGDNGVIECSGMLLVENQTVSYSEIIPINTLTGDPEIIFLDIANCTVLSLNIRLSMSADLAHNYRSSIFIAKQQGRGGYVLTGSLGSLDMYRGNQFNYPFPDHKQHATIWGIPKRYDFEDVDGVMTFKVPENYLIKPIYFHAKIVTDATVIDRIPFLYLVDSGTIIGSFGIVAAIPANRTRYYFLYPGARTQDYQVTGEHTSLCMSDYFDNKFEFEMRLVNVQAGDAFTEQSLYAYSIFIGNNV